MWVLFHRLQNHSSSCFSLRLLIDQKLPLDLAFLTWAAVLLLLSFCPSPHRDAGGPWAACDFLPGWVKTRVQQLDFLGDFDGPRFPWADSLQLILVFLVETSEESAWKVPQVLPAKTLLKTVQLHSLGLSDITLPWDDEKVWEGMRVKMSPGIRKGFRCQPREPAAPENTPQLTLRAQRQ